LDYYNEAKEKDKNILKLSAYLHDIGKGPKSKWKDGKQPAYPDHPADAPEMLERILVEDFKEISEYEIKKICILVTYHDLIGEIIGKGRSMQQLIDIIENEKTLEMLATLNFADVSAINRLWRAEYRNKIEDLKTEVLEKIS
jgi:UTP:GlnB (protein PII) uridylyltransferase